MGKYILVRTIWVFIILFVILSVTFILLNLAPQYPPAQEDERELYLLRQVADGFMTRELVTDEDRMQAIRDTREGVDEGGYIIDDGFRIQVYNPVPLGQQYFRWLSNIFTEFNWGVSTQVRSNVPAFEYLAGRIPVTAQLNIFALIFYIPTGFGIGILAALKKNSITDNLIQVFVMIFLSLPLFVVMTFFLFIFGFQLGWLPTAFPARSITGMTRVLAFVLPVLGLSLNTIAGLTRLTRAELTEVLTSDFLLLARTKGLTRPQSVVRHAMRNSMVPLVPFIVFSFVGLLSGSVVIEQIYGIPGTGRVLLQAMTPNRFDHNLVMVTLAFYTIIGLFAILVVDLSYGLVDPRIRMGARK